VGLLQQVQHRCETGACCSILQGVAVSCSMLQCVVVHFGVLQCVTTKAILHQPPIDPGVLYLSVTRPSMFAKEPCGIYKRTMYVRNSRCTRVLIMNIGMLVCVYAYACVHNTHTHTHTHTHMHACICVCVCVCVCVLCTHAYA